MNGPQREQGAEHPPLSHRPGRMPLRTELSSGAGPEARPRWVPGWCPAHSPPPLSSHLAMARKANSTFMPVLALVSMKGTPYSCQGERPQGPSLVAPTRHLPTDSRLPWPASLRPPNVSPFHCSRLPVKPRWVTLGKEALTPAGPSPAPTGPSFAPGAGAARPLLVAGGTAGGMIGMGPGFLPGAG